MGDSDGKVRIIIDTNANEVVKEINNVDTAFQKSADTIKKSSTLYGGYEKAVRDNVEVLRELALGGNQNTEGFKKLAAQTKEYKDALREANETVEKATGNIKNQEQPVDNLTSKLKGLVGAYLSLRGAQAVFSGIMKATEAYREQERAILSLNTALQNSGTYSLRYSSEIQKLASEIQNYSNYGDEAIIKAQALGQAYVGQTEITKNLTKAVVDFAAATGMDLEQAFVLVGKSIGSNTNALSRYGIQLKEGMSDSEKMDAITRQLTDRFQGQARQMADSSVQLKNAIGDLSEAIGGVFNPTLRETQSIMRSSIVAFTDYINKARVLRANISDLTTEEEIRTRFKENQKKLSRVVGLDDEYSKRVAKDIQKSQDLLIKQLEKIKTQETKINKERKSYRITDDTDYVIPKSYKTKNTVTSSRTSTPRYSGTANKAKQIKDAYDLATEAVEKARKAVLNTSIQFGTSAPETQKAFEQYRIANEKIANTQDVFKLTATKSAYEQLEDEVLSLTQSLRDLAAENKVNTDEWNNTKDALDKAKINLENVNKAVDEAQKKEENFAQDISRNISSGLISALQGGGNAFQAFSNIAVSALQKVLDKVIEMTIISPIMDSLKGTFGGGIFGGIASLFGLGFKNGAAFQNGNVIPFARGGIVNKPTLFPMKTGTGLMGEAGPEAVMPLTRKNGKLGVEATGANQTVVNIYNQSGASVETQKRDDGGMDIFIKKFNSAMSNERTSSSFRSAYQRENNKGVQAC